MDKLMVGILLLVGLINLYPVIGVVSDQMVMRLYRIEVQSNDLLILLRHRAVLFGLLGVFMVGAAFQRALQPWAIAVGLISMVSFVLIAQMAEGYGSGIRAVVVADVVASIALGIALIFWFMLR